jgi:hypothetical protein
VTRQRDGYPDIRNNSFLLQVYYLVMPTTAKVIYSSKGKDKVDPRTGHEGPEGEQRYSSTVSLTSALDRVGVQRHVLTALPPGKKSGTYSMRGWVGPRAGLDGCGKSRPHRDSIPGPSSP